MPAFDDGISVVFRRQSAYCGKTFPGGFESAGCGKDVAWL